MWGLPGSTGPLPGLDSGAWCHPGSGSLGLPEQDPQPAGEDGEQVHAGQGEGPVSVACTAPTLDRGQGLETRQRDKGACV